MLARFAFSKLNSNQRRTKVGKSVSTVSFRGKPGVHLVVVSTETAKLLLMEDMEAWWWTRPLSLSMQEPCSKTALLPRTLSSNSTPNFD